MHPEHARSLEGIGIIEGFDGCGIHFFRPLVRIQALQFQTCATAASTTATSVKQIPAIITAACYSYNCTNLPTATSQPQILAYLIETTGLLT